MSCSFNPKNCVNCPKYNGCLLQIIYANTLSLSEMITKLENNQSLLMNEISSINSINRINSVDTSDMSIDLESISSKLNSIEQTLQTIEDDKDELEIDLSQIKNSLSVVNLKVDDVLQKYEEYDYINPIGE